MYGAYTQSFKARARMEVLSFRCVTGDAGTLVRPVVGREAREGPTEESLWLINDFKDSECGLDFATEHRVCRLDGPIPMANLTTTEEELAAALAPDAAVGTDTRGTEGAPPRAAGSESKDAAKSASPALRRRRLQNLLSNPAYVLSAFIGLLTYGAYAALNEAWTNPALIAVALFQFLTTPLYSKYSNRIEAMAARLTSLETGGRIARYLFQLLDNLFLLCLFVVGRVIDPAALDGMGGFFAAAAWITIVSQGGQYLASCLARKGIGSPDRNVIFVIAISVTVSALAISGLTWIQPLYVIISLGFGAVIFGAGLLTDARALLERR